MRSVILFLDMAIICILQETFVIMTNMIIGFPVLILTTLIKEFKLFVNILKIIVETFCALGVIDPRKLSQS